MANSTSNIDALLQSQASKEVTANAFFDAASQATTYGRRASTCSGLTWGYYGGNVVKTDNTMTQVGNSTLTLTASATNYIVAAKATGVVSFSTGTTNWDDTTNYWRLYSVVTGASTVTSYTDAREPAKFTSGSGVSIVTLSYAATISVDLSTIPNGGTFRCTLTGNVTLNFTGGRDGQKVTLELKQDAVGSRLVTLGTGIAYGTDTPSFTATTTINKTDVLDITLSGSAYRLMRVAKGF